MRYLLLMSGEHEDMAVVEIESLLNARCERYGTIVIVGTRNNTLFSRLGYTKAVHQHLFSCDLKSLPREMESCDWKSIYQRDFCVRLHSTTRYSEAALAGYVWSSVKKPQVNLVNPTTKIEVFVHRNKAHVGLFLHAIEHDFEKRKSHLRPRLHPTSLHPKLARAMVNLTGIRKGTIFDPFCGSGGTLLEAGLMDLRVVGFDTNERVLNYARDNLKYYQVRRYTLKILDATKLRRPVNYVVTDMPYGRNTRADRGLYQQFILVLDKILLRRAVVGLPHYVNVKRLLRDTNLRIERAFTYYLHKSLQKRILVLEKSRRTT